MPANDAVVRPDLLEGIVRSTWNQGVRAGLESFAQQEPYLAAFARDAIYEMLLKCQKKNISGFDEHLAPEIERLVFVLTHSLRRGYAELWMEFELGRELLERDPTLASRMFVAPQRPSTDDKKGRKQNGK